MTEGLDCAVFAMYKCSGFLFEKFGVSHFRVHMVDSPLSEPREASAGKINRGAFYYNVSLSLRGS